MWDPQSYEDTDYGLSPGETFEPDDAWDALQDASTDAPHIMTVLGAILPEELGICLHHEHVLCRPGAAANVDPDLILDREDLAAEELEAFVTMNGRAVVDCSGLDYGRNVEGLVRIAGQVPVHLMTVTGRHNHLHASRMENAHDVNSMTSEFVTEIKSGVGNGSVRAGLIRTGTGGDEISSVERSVLGAAAAAHVATGAPVSAHTEAGTMALEHLSILASDGVDPNHVIVGGLDALAGGDSPLAIAETGAFLSFDQVGKSGAATDADRASMLVSLAEAGYADQLLISQDIMRRSSLLSYGGRPGLAHLLERFLLTLMEAGAEAMFVRKVLVENPARALTIHPPHA